MVISWKTLQNVMNKQTLKIKMNGKSTVGFIAGQRLELQVGLVQCRLLLLLALKPQAVAEQPWCSPHSHKYLPFAALNG